MAIDERQLFEAAELDMSPEFALATRTCLASGRVPEAETQDSTTTRPLKEDGSRSCRGSG